jgi:putative transposase
VLVRKAFRYRIYPTPVQTERLTAWEHALRWLWNLAHEQRLYGLRASTPRYYTAFDQIHELTALRAEAPWLADVPRDVCAQLLIELDKAWQRCFKKLGRQPRWKRRGRDSVPRCAPHPKSFRVDGEGHDGAVVFPKLGTLKAVVHRSLQGTPKTCAIARDGDAWFACISCAVEIPDPLPSTKPTVALDRGVVNLIVDSDGRVVPNPRPFETIRGRIARAQRIVARRKKGSKNQQRARRKVGVLHRKARWQRDAVLHRESSTYTKSHGTVIVERLDTRSMTASAKGTIDTPGTNVAAKAGLNRAILDGGWARFVNMLRYKVVPEGGTVIEVPAAYSSQTCAACGVVDVASRRSQAEFECVACGHRDHADVNAAKVLYTRGTHGGAGCGGSATRRPAKQQLRVARRGTRSSKVGTHSASAPKAPAFRPG